ncbi:unnamed protein product, partial [Mesocestoides corti]|uniref:Uncharacterized protein n=1 Tax=Mesocestoides corti TaxID=53468 RepID=A0A0R3ULT3_MESCO
MTTAGSGMGKGGRESRVGNATASKAEAGAVQHERGPRNSTLRRQVALMLQDRIAHQHRRDIPPTSAPASPNFGKPPPNQTHPFTPSPHFTPTYLSAPLHMPDWCNQRPYNPPHPESF